MNDLIGDISSGGSTEVVVLPESNMDVAAEMEVSSSGPVDEETQTDIPQDTTCMSSASVQTETSDIPHFSVEELRNNPDTMSYYTGLPDYFTFTEVLASLRPAANQLQYWNNTYPSVDVPSQFLLLLLKLRTYKPNFELSRMFTVTEKEVYGLLVTWIKFASLQWQEVDLWPEMDLVKFYALLTSC